MSFKFPYLFLLSSVSQEKSTNPLKTGIVVIVGFLSIFMHVCSPVCESAHVCHTCMWRNRSWCQELSVVQPTAIVLNNFSALFIEAKSLNKTQSSLTWLVLLASLQWDPFPSASEAGITAGCHACSVITWVLRPQTPVLIRVWQTT